MKHLKPYDYFSRTLKVWNENFHFWRQHAQKAKQIEYFVRIALAEQLCILLFRTREIFRVIFSSLLSNRKSIHHFFFLLILLVLCRCSVFYCRLHASFLPFRIERTKKKNEKKKKLARHHISHKNHWVVDSSRACVWVCVRVTNGATFCQCNDTCDTESKWFSFRLDLLIIFFRWWRKATSSSFIFCHFDFLLLFVAVIRCRSPCLPSFALDVVYWTVAFENGSIKLQEVNTSVGRRRCHCSNDSLCRRQPIQRRKKKHQNETLDLWQRNHFRSSRIDFGRTLCANGGAHATLSVVAAMKIVFVSRCLCSIWTKWLWRSKVNRKSMRQFLVLRFFFYDKNYSFRHSLVVERCHSHRHCWKWSSSLVVSQVVGRLTEHTNIYNKMRRSRVHTNPKRVDSLMANNRWKLKSFHVSFVWWN